MTTQRTTNNEQRATDHERAKQLDALLDALESMPADEHKDYLARACPDPELRREALAVLAGEAQAEGYLEHFAGLVEELAPKRPEPPDMKGRRIGTWRLIKPLGRGGMGLVYEAERDDGTYKHRVALKLLTAALTGTEAYQRFLTEREILAGLEHPAIARIVDGGVTDDGTPWFAMEYVEGLPIDDYCDQHELGIRERLELFLQVCDAVEHAHRRLVVHRDLKPANVLVTERATNNKQRTTIKLLDFGIAKLLDTDQTATTPATRTTLRVMTLEYASPEQIRGQPVTTASDVYQLGLLLYELLTGHRPYVLKHHSAGELEHVICEQPPTRLSSAITRDDTLKRASHPTTNNEQRTTGIACKMRRSTPTKLRRRLRGDLENIVGKALSKEPGRRYGSADRLAQDIRRHLTGLPISARAHTWTYRSRKFFQRHALGAAAAAMMIMLVAGITGFYLTHLRSAYEQAETERVQAQFERDRAETALVQVEAEAAKARQVSQFLAEIFQDADPIQSGNADLSARDLLERGVTKVDQELATQPDIQAEMLRVLGRTYLSMRMLDQADELLNRALDMNRQQHGENHPLVGRVLSDLGWLRFRQARYPQSRELLERAVSLMERGLDEDTLELAEALLYLGRCLNELEEPEAALETLERALAIQERVSGPDSIPMESTLAAMGFVHWHLANFDRAADAHERALAIAEKQFGPDSVRFADRMMNLASSQTHRGIPERTESMYRRIIAIYENAYGPSHFSTAIALNNLGLLLVDLERSDEAIKPLEEALEVYRTVAPDHPNIGFTMSLLGIAHFTGEHLDEARHYFEQSEAMWDGSIEEGQFHPGQIIALVWLGRAEAALGNQDAADEHLTRALELLRRAPDFILDPADRFPLQYLSRWLAGQGRCEEAESLFRQTFNIRSAWRHAFDIPTDEMEKHLAQCRTL